MCVCARKKVVSKRDSGVVTTPDVLCCKAGRTPGVVQPVTASVTPTVMFGSLNLYVLTLGLHLTKHITNILSTYASVMHGPQGQNVPAICWWQHLKPSEDLRLKKIRI